MATSETKANARADNWQITIGGNPCPIHASLRLSAGARKVEIKSGRYGDDVLGSIVNGRYAEGELVFRQTTEPEVIEALDITAGAAPKDLPAVGTVVPTRTLLLHDPADGATTTNDLFFYAVEFGEMRNDHDGAGLKEFVVPFRATRDSNGKVGRVGPAT